MAIEQRASRGGLKSTVATLTEIYHFLRLIYVKLAMQYCPDCNVAIAPQSPEHIAMQIERAQRGQAHPAAGAPDRASQGHIYANWRAGRRRAGCASCG